MTKIAKQINELLKAYRTVFLVRLPLTGAITVYAQNTRDVDYLATFCHEVEDHEVFDVLKGTNMYYDAIGDTENETKYYNALLKLKEQEGLLDEQGEKTMRRS